MKHLICCHHITLIFSRFMTSTTASNFIESDIYSANSASMLQIYKKFAIFPNKSRKNHLLNSLKQEKIYSPHLIISFFLFTCTIVGKVTFG